MIELIYLKIYVFAEINKIYFCKWNFIFVLNTIIPNDGALDKTNRNMYLVFTVHGIL